MSYFEGLISDSRVIRLTKSQMAEKLIGKVSVTNHCQALPFSVQLPCIASGYLHRGYDVIAGGKMVVIITVAFLVM